MSIYLIYNKIAYTEHFDKWWNAQNFNWENDSWELAKFCYAYFDKWWDENKFNWQNGSWALAQYCHDYFDKWWNPEKFNPFHLRELEEYCAEYKDKWIELKLYTTLQE